MTTRSGSARLSRVLARFSSLADAWLAARVVAWACVLPLLKRFLPIRSLVKLAWRSPRFAPDAEREERVITFARWACRLTRWRAGGNCLERGLIVYRFLLEDGAHPTLVVGVGHDVATNVLGHAWVLVNGEPAGESAAAVSEYVPVFAFGPDGRLIKTFGPSTDAASPSLTTP
jgi:hypothetical protein